MDRNHGAAGSSRAEERPNVVLVLVDDVRADDLGLMDRVQTKLAARGVSFDNAFVTNSLCCPSRATILTGLYPHNHGVLTNRRPSGGYQATVGSPVETASVARALRKAGYRTALFGKYFNHYATERVPPGWSMWQAFYGGYDDRTLNVNGTLTELPPGTNPDTEVKRRALAWAGRKVEEGRPFFAVISTHAVHEPYYAPWRDDVSLPYSPSFGEKDISDKPNWVSSQPSFVEEEKRYQLGRYRARAGQMLLIDSTVEDLIGVLQEKGVLSKTYVILVSDNGFLLGEHRLSNKKAAYEEAIRVPLVIRGPGIPAGATRKQMVLNNDLAPTILQWTGVAPLGRMDGRSLAPLLDTDHANDPKDWRDAFLVEHEHAGKKDPPTYSALRARGYTYVEYETGETELYDLTADPYQLDSVHTTTEAPLAGKFRGLRLAALKSCAADSCRAAEGR